MLTWLMEPTDEAVQSLQESRASKLSPDVSYLPGGDGAEDVDDTVGFLLTLLGILLAKQPTAAERTTGTCYVSLSSSGPATASSSSQRSLSWGLCLM